MAREIDALSTKLKQTSLESPTEIPFRLNQLGIPRYLFRVFSAGSAGQNDKRWMKSLDAKYAKQGNLTDIFDRPDGEVAIALNEHLWKMVFATKVKNDTLVDAPRVATWECGGLPKLLSLRKTHYFGEYLAQGQLCIENRSFVVSCDKIITKDLLRMVPALQANLEEPRLYWAKATLQLREPFNAPDQFRVISDEDVTAIKKITWSSFPERWTIVMFTSLLGLYPRCMENLMENLGFVSELLDSISDETLDKCLSQKTIIDTSRYMPEVLQSGHLIDAVYKEYTSRCYDKLPKYAVRYRTDSRHSPLIG
ncbi:hypothetical protein E8E14_014094 [Neopestalotiopsis sp. 37M]|nr:hypothetical protein E8E14_014094 [Neopestalotiopsis sp. 37M]